MAVSSGEMDQIRNINAINQTSIEECSEDNRLLDFVIEFGIHNNLRATVGESFAQLPRHKMCSLRRITLKCVIIYYAQTVIFMDERNKLMSALTCLQKIFNEIDQKQKIVKTWQALQRAIEYQIVVHHLTLCGSQSAMQMIDKYFPKQT
eukprot:329181_1